MCSNKAEAEDAAGALWGDHLAGILTAPEAAPLTLGDLVDWFCKRTESHTGRPLSPRTARAYRSQLQALEAVAGRDLTLRFVREGHVRRALRPDLSQATRAQYLRAFRAMFAAARRHWPDDGISDPTATIRVSDKTVMRPWLEEWEIPLYLAALPVGSRLRAEFILETGLRAREATAASWADVSTWPGGGSLRVSADAAKGAREGAVPLSSRAVDLLALCAERWGRTGYLLHAEAAPVRPENWTRRWVAMVAKANEERAEAGLPAVRAVGAHALRRTCGATLLLRGMPIEQVSRLLRHKDIKTTWRCYAGIADATMQAAMARADAERLARAIAQAIAQAEKDGSGETTAE